MFGLGKRQRSLELQYLREHGPALKEKFFDWLDGTLAIDELDEPETVEEELASLLNVFDNLLAGSVMEAKVMAQNADLPFAKVIEKLSNRNKAAIADFMVRTANQSTDPGHLEEITFSIVAMTLYHSAGEIFFDDQEFDLIIQVITGSEINRERTRDYLARQSK